MPCASWAKALPPTTTAANNAMPRAKPANRAEWCTVFPPSVSGSSCGCVKWEAVVSVDPKAKRSASSYLNILWVQHIDILPTAQDGLVWGGDHIGGELRRSPYTPSS